MSARQTHARRLRRPDRRCASHLIDLMVSRVLVGTGPLNSDGYALWDCFQDSLDPGACRHRSWWRHRTLSQPRHHRAWQAACRLAARLGLPQPRQFGREVTA